MSALQPALFQPSDRLGDPGTMSARDLFHQAWRELRANGRIGYAVLRAPRMRYAAVECLRMRLERDSLDAVRQRIVYAAMSYEIPA